MNTISLSSADLGLAAFLVLIVAGLTYRLGSDQAQPLVIAALRTIIQLMLIGIVLNVLFESSRGYWVAITGLGMGLVAGYEVNARQKHPFKGWWGYGLGTLSLFVSTLCVLLLTLVVIVQPDPWYHPRYVIPLLGMLLGNSMTGIALALDRLTGGAWQQRGIIEARLMLGQDWNQAINEIRGEALRSGLMPIINAMAAAGVVSLPGMMTGQILAGALPMDAVKYQILILFLITAVSGVGVIIATRMGSRRLFDQRERLVLERLKAK
jgi:putative ABC transport system permease protein